MTLSITQPPTTQHSSKADGNAQLASVQSQEDVSRFQQMLANRPHEEPNGNNPTTERHNSAAQTELDQAGGVQTDYAPKNGGAAETGTHGAAVGAYGHKFEGNSQNEYGGTGHKEHEFDAAQPSPPPDMMASFHRPENFAQLPTHAGSETQPTMQSTNEHPASPIATQPDVAPLHTGALNSEGVPAERTAGTSPSEGDIQQLHKLLGDRPETPAGLRSPAQQSTDTSVQQSEKQDHTGSKNIDDEANAHTPVPTGQPAPQSLGNAILDRMESAAPVSTHDGTLSQVQELVQKVAAQILVAAPDASGPREIRIQIKNDLLPGTEVRVSTENGKLTVQCLCSDSNAERVVNLHRDALQAVLEKRYPNETVSVSVGNAEQADRSGGDGRSRQQRNLYDEMQQGWKA